MANIPNLNFVPCVDTVDENPVKVPNAASDLRTPNAQPVIGTKPGSSAAPSGPQLWPL